MVQRNALHFCHVQLNHPRRAYAAHLPEIAFWRRKIQLCLCYGAYEYAISFSPTCSIFAFVGLPSVQFLLSFLCAYVSGCLWYTAHRTDCGILHVYTIQYKCK